MEDQSLVHLSKLFEKLKNQIEEVVLIGEFTGFFFFYKFIFSIICKTKKNLLLKVMVPKFFALHLSILSHSKNLV